MIEMKYYYKDEFGQETETRKTYTEDVLETSCALDFLMSDFKQHLLSCGFSGNLIREFALIYFPSNP